MGDPTRPKPSARAWVESYLKSNPGSDGPGIVAAAAAEGVFARSSVYKAIRALRNARAVSAARGRYWSGSVGDPELAIDAEVERTIALLKSPSLSDVAKVEAARQLGRDSGAVAPRSRAVLTLFEAGAGQPREVREALLPFVQRSVRAAARERGSQASPGAARRTWHAAEQIVRPFLDDAGGAGTLAWNTVYEAVDAGNVLDDEELLELAGLATDLEIREPLPPPSPARAVLRRIASRDRLRNRVRARLLDRLAGATDAAQADRIRGLARATDLGPSPAEAVRERRPMPSGDR